MCVCVQVNQYVYICTPRDTDLFSKCFNLYTNTYLHERLY